MTDGKVKNWQIRREMAYPYGEKRPARQFGAIFDTNKCIGCQTCTKSDKITWTNGRGMEYMFWNNTETKPYGFYPLAWDVRILDLLGPQKWERGIYTGNTVFEATSDGNVVLGYLPEDLDYAHPNIGEDEPYGQVERGDHIVMPHKVWHFYLPRICNHCTYPACLASCPRKAIYKREEDGIVLIDQKRCRGYKECVRACPYKKTYYNEVTKISEKCIACYPLVEQNEQVQCTKSCIGKIRLNGWIHPPEKADSSNPIDYLVHVRKLALPLYPQFGLEPNVYYIPPIHVPIPYLRQMFGPGAEEAIAGYKAAFRDETVLGAFMLFGATDRWISRFAVGSGWATGYDDQGKELVKVPIKEPEFLRPFYDEKHEVYRHNLT